MRDEVALVLFAIGIGAGGCAGALQGLDEDLKRTNEALAAPKRGSSSASIDVIGAAGGHRVRNVPVAVPDLSCSGKAYPGAKDAFVAGFKAGYVKTWNDALSARSPVATLARTAKQKQRLAYFQSKEIKPPADAQESAYRFDIKPSRVMMEKNPKDASPSEREAYMQASCVRSAYHKGGSKGIDQAQDDVRPVIDQAPPDI
jgi:hypothetical protein